MGIDVAWCSTNIARGDGAGLVGGAADAPPSPIISTSLRWANSAVIELRCWLTWNRRGCRGRKGDPGWDLRRLLLRNADGLSEAKQDKLIDTFSTLCEHGCTLLGGWIIKRSFEICSLGHTSGHRLEISQLPVRIL